MSLAILGWGSALPSYSYSQATAAAVAHKICCRDREDMQRVSDIFAHSGIEKRHMVHGEQFVQDILQGTKISQSAFLPNGAEEERGPSTCRRMECYAAEAPPLAQSAAGLALEKAGKAGTDITHLVTVSCTGFAAPGVDIELMGGLQLSPGVQRTHVGFMGCHGALNGLRVARAYAEADPAACVLLCAVELCSVHIHYGWDPQVIVPSALFADGAAALVGVSDTSAELPRRLWRAVANASCVFPHSEKAMTWTIGDHGFEMTLSTRVPRLIAENLRSWLAGWLDRCGLQLAEVASWAVHPGGPRILEAVQDSLALSKDRLDVSRQILAECGNMSSPTVLFILERLADSQAPLPCVALAFGPGLTVEAVLFT